MSEIEQYQGELQGEDQGGSREATQSAGQGESRGERQTESQNERQSEPQDEHQNEPLFYDALFHQKRKRGRWRIVEVPSLEAPVADTHCHLHFLKDPALALARAAIHRVEFICEIVDISEDSSEPFDKMDIWLAQAEALIPRLIHASAIGDVAEGTVENANGGAALAAVVAAEGAKTTLETTPHVPRIRMVVGCHPHNAKDYNDEVERNLCARLADPRVCAVGEIGLDYHYDFSPRDQQRQVFRRQLRIAKQAGLPVALHIREAHDDAFAILEDEGFPEAGCLLHCFNLDWNELERWCDRGCFVAFGGPLTFKKTDEVRDAAARAPLHLLLTETDAPFMTPEPLRGTTCGPEHVVFTAQCMCDVRGCEKAEQRQELLEALMANARALLDRDATEWQREHGV